MVHPEHGPVGRYDFETEVCSLGLCESGRLVVALRKDVILFDPDTRARSHLATPSPEPAGNRLNDGKVGPDGAFWVGSMDDTPALKPCGTLWRIDATGRCEVKAQGTRVSNGLAFSPDGTRLYWSDSRGPWVDVFDFDVATVSLSHRRRFVDLTEAAGRPDGAAMDVEGHYWSAGVSAGVLNRFAPDGKLVATFHVPVPAPTMLCFAGQDMRSLFVTSHRKHDAETLAGYPLSGDLIVARAPVAGAPVPRFSGA
jgi:sugar lactone lactonase YvrE